MCKKLLTVLLVLVLSSVVSAVHYQRVNDDLTNPTYWDDSDNWNTNTDSSGSYGIPTIISRAKNYTGLQLDVYTASAVCDKIQQMNGNMNIKSGGVVTTNGSVEFNPVLSTITIEAGGTMNACTQQTASSAYTAFKLGRDSSSTGATVNVSGTLNVLSQSTDASELNIGIWNNGATGGGGGGASWTLNINDGGAVNANALTVDGIATDGTAKIDIETGGVMVIDGDVTGYIYTLTTGSATSNGYIVMYGDGIAGNITSDYNITNAGKTTVYVPEPATIALLGLGGLLLRKRR